MKKLLPLLCYVSVPTMLIVSSHLWRAVEDELQTFLSAETASGLVVVGVVAQLALCFVAFLYAQD